MIYGRLIFLTKDCKLLSYLFGYIKLIETIHNCFTMQGLSKKYAGLFGYDNKKNPATGCLICHNGAVSFSIKV
jgi:hypothetical protein